MRELVSKMTSYLQKNNNINSILLGGSRSKGYATEKSDYDFFLLIQTDDFGSFKDSFSLYLEHFQLIDQAAYYGYVENWGYVFKAIGFYQEKNILFDISVLPLSRVDEMALRATNILLYDRNQVAKSAIEHNTNRSFDASVLEPQRKTDYIKLFGFEVLRFEKSIDSEDLWLAVKSLERMKQYYMHYKRILECTYACNQHCPEKHYGDAFPDDILDNIYEIKVDLDVLNNVKTDLCAAFLNLIDEKRIINRFFNLS